MDSEQITDKLLSFLRKEKDPSLEKGDIIRVVHEVLHENDDLLLIIDNLHKEIDELEETILDLRDMQREEAWL